MGGLGAFGRAASRQVTPRQAGVALGLTVGLYGQTHIAARILNPNNLTNFFIEYLVRTTGGETDAQQVGPLYGGPPTGYDPQNTYQKLHRPLIPGCSVGGASGGTGTLGAFVDVDGRLYILSNNHVLAGSSFDDATYANRGDPIWQPGGVDGGNPNYKVATLTSWLPFGRNSVNKVDCAIAAIDPGITINVCYGGHCLLGFRSAIPGERVFKVGRTTGFTVGTIDLTESSETQINYATGVADFDDQIFIVGYGGEPFSLQGDSGSLVIAESDHKAVGLIFGGNQGGSYSIACPITTVLSTFRARLVAT